MKKQINVVGAVIVRNGRVLAAKRGMEKSLPGMWEFPGGKIESGETAKEALHREIVEELSCHVLIGEEIITYSHEYDFGVVKLSTYYCELISGEPNLTEHVEIRWLLPSELEQVEWAPADIPTIKVLSSNKLNGG